MAGMTLDELQGRIAAIVDQDEDTSAISTDDYSLRTNYINQAQTEWANTYDWQVLYAEYNMRVSAATGNASIVLPAGFRKLASFPIITYDGTTDYAFPEVRPQENEQYTNTDKRVNVLGNPNDGYILRVLGCALVTGASVKVPYYTSPISLVSPADQTMCPNPNFLVQRTVAILWEAREDQRFPQAKVEAEKLLRNMIEYENVFSEAAENSRIRTYDTTHKDFRWGED